MIDHNYIQLMLFYLLPSFGLVIRLSNLDIWRHNYLTPKKMAHVDC